MTNESRITEARAQQILAKAAELDRAQSQLTSVEALRAAAREAGIADSAFDAALTEVEGGERREPFLSRRRLLLQSLVVGVIVLLIGWVTLRSPIEEPAAPVDVRAVPAIPTPTPAPTPTPNLP